MSVGLIIVSIVEFSGLELNFSSNYISLMQIIFSVLILAYTLLLALGDYSARAVKIHRCGMELGRISRELDERVANSQAATPSADSHLKRYYERV